MYARHERRPDLQRVIIIQQFNNYGNSDYQQTLAYDIVLFEVILSRVFSQFINEYSYLIDIFSHDTFM